MHTTEIKITPEQWAAQRQSELQERKKMAFIDAIIKGEKLNLKGHEKGWQHHYMVNMTAGRDNAAYSAPIFEYGDKWARLMQIEMRKTNSPKLTPEIVKTTEDTLGEYAMRARGLLVSAWAYGSELGTILGWSKDVIKASRHNFSNEVVLWDFQSKQKLALHQRQRS